MAGRDSRGSERDLSEERGLSARMVVVFTLPPHSGRVSLSMTAGTWFCSLSCLEQCLAIVGAQKVFYGWWTNEQETIKGAKAVLPDSSCICWLFTIFLAFYCLWRGSLRECRSRREGVPLVLLFSSTLPWTARGCLSLILHKSLLTWS